MKLLKRKEFLAAASLLLMTSLACSFGSTAATPTPEVIVVTATNSPDEVMTDVPVANDEMPTATATEEMGAPPPLPTAAPLPTNTTSAPSAPADSDIVTSLNIKNDNKTLNEVISYPSGDTTDQVYVNVSGFDSITTSGTVTLTAVCSGTGSGNVEVVFIGNLQGGTPACNSTWTAFVGNDSNQMTVRFLLDAGPNAYVNWTLILSANN